MNFESLLEKINLSQQSLNYLNGVILCRPQYKKKNNLITMKIINNNFLPYQVIEELNSKLADYLKLNVKLTFKIIDHISSSLWLIFHTIIK